MVVARCEALAWLSCLCALACDHGSAGTASFGDGDGGATASLLDVEVVIGA